MKLNATHFFLRAPEKDWIPLPFVTRQINDRVDHYYYGFETFREISAKSISKQLKDKALKPLSWPVAITHGQALWLTPDNEVYIALENDPIGDKDKLMLGLASNDAVLESAWKSGYALKELMRSSVTQNIFERGEFNYVFGDYMASVQSPSNGKVYSPEWQITVLSMALRELEKATKNGKGVLRHLKLERWQEQEHRYRHIEELIVKEGLPIHWEMIFKTWRREMMIDIIHLANVHKLSLVFPRNCLAQKKLGLEDQQLFGKHFDGWIKNLDETRTEVCAPTDQASEHLLLHAITKRKLNRDQKTERSTVAEIKSWISDDPKKNQRIVVCDIGIAHRLKAACASKLELMMAFVPYDAPIPVGIAHRKDDAVWRSFLMREIRKAARSKTESVRKSLEDTQSRCKALGMNWVWRN